MELVGLMGRCFGISYLLLWWMLLLWLPISVVVKTQAFTGTYGINYGRVADNLPAPESVVTLLKAAKIKNVRIYDANQDVLKAFSKQGLEIVIGLPNENLKDIGMNEDSAMTWVKQNVQAYLPDTQIRGIAVGNEVFGSSDLELAEYLLPAVKNVYSALNRLQLTATVQVSTAHSQAVFASSFPPSACTFKQDYVQYMKPLLEFFSNSGSPFYVNVYPFLAYKSDPVNIDINYALFKSNAGVYDGKTNLHYDNMFEAQVDAAYVALENAGYGNMEVIVSETGWPSKGDSNEAGATLDNAKTYNFNMRRLLAKKRGTPFRPDRVMKAYIFALFNEDSKPGPTSERNFGLFKPDGSIAYDIGFTGLMPSSSPPSVLLSFKVIVSQGLYGSYMAIAIACTATLSLAFWL